MARLIGHTDGVYGFLFQPINQDILISGARDKSIRVWDTLSASCLLHNADAHYWGIHELSMSADGKKLVSASDDYDVRVWSVEIDELA